MLVMPPNIYKKYIIVYLQLLFTQKCLHLKFEKKEKKKETRITYKVLRWNTILNVAWVL